MNAKIAYTPPPTVARFMASPARVRGLMGPVGSGKSSGCCWELFRRMCTQAPDGSGVRRSRFLVVRNTYGELKHTTLATWQSWFAPEVFGPVSATRPMVHHLRFNDVEAEVLFMALDKAHDARKLKSLELTGAWVNEASEVAWPIVRTLLERVGRYPSRRDGGPTWHGVIMDSNPPHDRHWWFRKFEEEKPHNWAIFRQPSGLAPEAENTANLPADYYRQIMEASRHDPDVVEVMVHGRYGAITQGEPVFGRLWHEAAHVAALPLAPLPLQAGKPVIIGLDFGLTPAAVFLQQHAQGIWHVLLELVPDGIMGAEQFAPHITAAMKGHFAPGQGFELWGDPAGGQRSQADARTAFDVFRGQGLFVRASPTQNLADRLAVVRTCLGRRIEGVPGLVISPACMRLRQALRGGYHYALVHEGLNPRPAEKPAKDEHSHIADALQYALAGGGEWHRLKSANRHLDALKKTPVAKW